ncbi:MAG: TonB-dependent receptor, partial [Bacteroidota bacterium]
GSFTDAENPGGHGWPGALSNYFWKVEQLSNTKSLFGNLRLTHVLSPTTFYEVGISYFKRSAKTYDPDFGEDFESIRGYTDSVAARNLGRLINDRTSYQTRWVGPTPYSVIYRWEFTHPYSPVGSYGRNHQTSLGFTIDLTSQVTTSWELKAGGRLETWLMRSYSVGDIASLNEFIARSGNQYHPDSIARSPYLARDRDVRYSNAGLINYYGYDIFGNEVSSGIDGPRKPTFASAYFQNKLEFRDLVLNIGARYEYFDQHVQTIDDFDNPAWDANLNYFADPESQLKDTEPAHLILPRVSFSFPVTDRTVFYAMYGKYAQLPPLGRLFSGSNYLAGRISPTTRSSYTLTSTPAGSGFLVRPERTTQFEMGIRQSLSDNFALTVTGFYKDVRDQIQLKRIFNQAGVPMFVAYRNEDFSTIKGLELTLELRRTNRLAARVNYTLSDARGSASTPASSRVAVSDEGQARFPNFISPFEFNQAHRGTIFVDYRWAKGDGGPILEGLGFNMVLSFNSGHNYTKILEPRILGQASVWNIGVRALMDPRTRTPVEPVNSSSTPWVFNIDLNASKVIYLGDMSVELYANILNLLNTQQVINVFPNTGTPSDDGWLRSPLSASYKEIPRYTEFYQAINIENRWAYINATGNDVYSAPRQIRFGLKLEI